MCEETSRAQMKGKPRESGIAIQRCLGKLHIQLRRSPADTDAAEMLAIRIHDWQATAQ
ncbi:hypothetical protein D3C85_1772560 [compost metagenome]